MQPRLWNRHMTFEEWRLQHHNLNERDAYYFYLNELKLFENHQQELINQQINVQNQIIGESLYNLSENISNIFNVAIDVDGTGFNFVLPRDAESTPNLELITDEGDLLVTDEGDFLIT
mgnify:CR=1 FL=1